MSDRLGRALVAYIRAMPADSKFILMEGIPEDVALALARSWQEGGGLPALAVASSIPKKFGKKALSGVTATKLRSRHAKGVCIVVCEGAIIPDRQSIKKFENVAPSDLLSSFESLSLLAQVDPQAPLDGPSRTVRQTILTLPIGERPSALSVAVYFDALAAGADPLEALPLLGAFADHARGGVVDVNRISVNFGLANRRRLDEVIGPAASALARRRAQRVIARRPGVDRKQAEEIAAEIIGYLQSGDDRLLEAVTFDEASEILGATAPDLAAEVEQQLDDYRNEVEDEGDEAAIPWEQYRGFARSLRRPSDAKQAARELLEFDDLESRRVFQPPTRKKLERLLKDSVIRTSSCPEFALLQAIRQLGGEISRIQLLNPDPPAEDQRTRSAAQRAISLACARLRTGGLLRRLNDDHAVEIDGLLLRSADDGLWTEVFEEADLATRRLPAVELRVHGSADGDRVALAWVPDFDDLAALRTAIALTGQPCLALRIQNTPSVSAFCSGPPPVAEPLPAEVRPLAERLRSVAAASLSDGMSPEVLQGWAHAWTSAVEKERNARREKRLEHYALAGAVLGGGAVGLSPFAPLKAEWTAAYLADLWGLIETAVGATRVATEQPLEETAAAIARSGAAHYPAFLRIPSSDRPLLPTAETRIWALFGARGASDDAGYSAAALGTVIQKLLSLQPEAAGHLRCLAWGPGAADLLIKNAVALLSGSQLAVREVEVFCAHHRPAPAVLADADESLLRGGREHLRIRYLDSLADADALLARGGEPGVHLAVATGLTEGGGRLQVNVAEVPEPAQDPEVLFTPRTWLRPGRSGWMLLMPPAASPACLAWLRLASALDDGWSDEGEKLRVPELRTGTRTLKTELEQLHNAALWVATIDRYATRDSLEETLEDVAILHQERRLSGESPISLVISQRSGGPVDRAIGRSLRSAGIVQGEIAFDYGSRIRQVASQGYGILALQAATTGAGINELIGHVVAFSLLGAKSTPWPLPPHCRVLLVSLDDHANWFLGTKRADLIALAVDTQEGGLHAAVIEVKARRSDPQIAGTQALDQLRKTLTFTRWAAYPEPDSVHSRLWLNRLAEAAYAVVRESRFRLGSDEIAAIEQFRKGDGTLEWAGLGLVFHPEISDERRDYPMPLAGDRVPIVIHAVRLTEPIISAACETDLGEMYTVEAKSKPLGGGRVRRRPERGTGRPIRPASSPGPSPIGTGNAEAPGEPSDEPEVPAISETVGEVGSEEFEEAPEPQAIPFTPPVLGWDAMSGEEVRWEPTGERGAELGNGHIEVWGSSGMGKTQFTMSLLAQLSGLSGTRFGIADFKNDYSSASNDFPRLVSAEFIDLWEEGAPYNPLALRDREQRTIESAQIELRDAVDVATRSFTKMGHRQLNKFRQVLSEAYEIGRREDRWPTMMTVNDLLDDDLSGVIGDLTRNRIFRDGPPLGEVVNANVIFGLSMIPGNGLTTVLAAGFILSALLLKIQSMPPVANTVRYALVVDEAHRVAAFKAIDTMIREGRSKGLAVILATQQPSDLPDVVAANAATKICFRLPDATIAAAAAKRLDPSDPTLAEQLRTLNVGEGFVRMGGRPPRLLSMCQLHRDQGRLGIVDRKRR